MLIGSAVSIAGALLVRPSPVPPSAMLPALSSTASVARLGVSVRVVRDGSGTGVWVRATKPLSAPDPLLYWTATTPADSSSLPAAAVYLGSLSGQFQAPVRIDSLPRGGSLAIWSNGYRRIIASAPSDLEAAAR